MKTDLVWRDPGDLEPVYDPFPITSEFTLPEAVTQTYTCMWHLGEAGHFCYGKSPRTLPFRELHTTVETIMWKDPGGLSRFTICLRLLAITRILYSSRPFKNPVKQNSKNFLNLLKMLKA